MPADQRQTSIEIEFNGHETVKHLIESIGVPHAEVDVIFINGQPVDFKARVADLDQVAVYPRFVEFEVMPLIRLCPIPQSEPRFVLDCHLGKLAVYLRLLGFDTYYHNDLDDDRLAEISAGDGRILLSRDRGLLKRSLVSQGYCVRAKEPQLQAVEIVRRYALFSQAHLFSRCARCNGILNPVSKAEIEDRLEPKTRLFYEEFRICQACNQIYWRGSHFDRMESQLKSMLEAGQRNAKLKEETNGWSAN